METLVERGCGLDVHQATVVACLEAAVVTFWIMSSRSMKHHLKRLLSEYARYRHEDQPDSEGLILKPASELDPDLYVGRAPGQS